MNQFLCSGIAHLTPKIVSIRPYPSLRIQLLILLCGSIGGEDYERVISFSFLPKNVTFILAYSRARAVKMRVLFLKVFQIRLLFSQNVAF